MSITQKKLEQCVQDVLNYRLGKVDCNKSGIQTDKNLAKIKEAIERGFDQTGAFSVNPKDRPNDNYGFNSDDVKASGLSFQDSESRIHRALAVKEKLFTGNNDFNVGKIVRAKLLGDFTGLNDVETKAAGSGIGSLGGWLVNDSVSAKVLDMARNQASVMKAGAYTMPMPTPEMRLVKITGDPTAYVVGEHQAITESDWTLSPINLKAVTVGCLVRSSLELLEDAANSGTALEQAMAASIALKLDSLALYGSGSGEPRGLDNADGVNLISKGVNGGTLANYDDFSNAVEDVSDHNGQANAVIYAPRTHYTLDRLKAATTNNRLEAPQSFVDLKKFVTNQISITDTQGTCTSASKAFVGDYKNILFGIRKNLEIEFSKTAGQDTFAKCEALIRLRIRLDIGILRENHFTKISGIKV